MKASLKSILMMFAFLIIFIQGCEKDDDNAKSPASKFVGKYKSLQPILVKIKTDYCSLSTLEDVATIEWDVFWEVTETSDPNIVDIKMAYYSHDFTITNSNCSSGAGYLPEPSPLFIKGYITGESLTIKYDNQEFGTFNFSNNEFSGKMKYSYCIAFCQEIYTDDYEFNVEKY